MRSLSAFGAAAATLIVAISPVLAAGWFVQKNEQVPFDKSKSTFIATTMNAGEALALRCLEGTVSLLVATGASNASAGDQVDLKIVADNKDVQEETAEVINSTNFATAIQFGDESLLDYLEGVQKISVRMTVAGATTTVSFLGGRTLNDVIAKTRKACGLEQIEPSKAPPASASAPQVVPGPKTQACKAQFDRLNKSGDLGANPDEAGFVAWCTAQASGKP
jgi:hypothetical protein